MWYIGKLTFPPAIFYLATFSSFFLFAEHGNDPITFVCLLKIAKYLCLKSIHHLQPTHKVKTSRTPSILASSSASSMGFHNRMSSPLASRPGSRYKYLGNARISSTRSHGNISYSFVNFYWVKSINFFSCCPSYTSVNFKFSSLGKIPHRRNSTSCQKVLFRYGSVWWYLTCEYCDRSYRGFLMIFPDLKCLKYDE